VISIFRRRKPKGKMYSLRCNQCGSGFLSSFNLDAPICCRRILHLLQLLQKNLSRCRLLVRGKHIRRLAVKKAGGNSITGIITLMSIVGNVPSDKVDFAEVELPTNVIEREATKIICPYC
jgi:hypothetical protein